RHRLIENALLICAATRNLGTLENILAGTGSDAIDPPQVVLGRVLRLQVERKWKVAAENAREGTVQFPSYFTLYQQEAFSWLCAGDAITADKALQRYPLPFQMDKGAIGWLKALIALKKGDQEMVRESLSLYLLQYPLTDRRNEENLTPPPASPDAGYSNRTIPNRSSGFALGRVLAEQEEISRDLLLRL